MKLVIDIPEETYLRYKTVWSKRRGSVPESCIAFGTPLENNKCKWIHYDYRTICPKSHDVDNPYWRIPENRMDVLKYCPYCGKEIELEADKEEIIYGNKND